MKIINFEDAKAKIRSKEKNAKHLPDVEKVDDDDLELQKQYQELAQFYNRWYDEHVVRMKMVDGYIKIYEILLGTSLVCFVYEKYKHTRLILVPKNTAA